MNTIEWYDPAKDPAVIRLAESIKQRARWSLPDVLVEYDRPLPEVDRIIPLFQERIEHLAQNATSDIGEQVEHVVAGAKIMLTDAFHVPYGGPPDLAETRTSRARAERMALARQVLETAARVETASDVHRREVDALRKAAIDAARYLNVIFHEAHRFADKFTFVLPDTLELDDSVYEIGLARVHDALSSGPTDNTDQEGAA